MTLWQTRQPHLVCGRTVVSGFGRFIDRAGNASLIHAEAKWSDPGGWRT